MNRMTLVGETGLKGSQYWIENIGHNVANVSTPGYRSRDLDFESALVSEVDQANLPDLAQGNGVQTMGVRMSQEQGGIEASGRALDVALEGTGFFVVQNSEGAVRYTRDGTFYADSEGNLTAGDGSFVLGVDDEPINLGSELGEISIDTAGEIRRGESADSLGQLKVVSFENPERLRNVGKQRFEETDSSGAAAPITPGTPDTGSVRQGYRESSNVSLADELTDLMRAQRAFQFAARLVQQGDELDAGAADTASQG
jgi:flagellar basal-body rod protein FlgG